MAVCRYHAERPGIGICMRCRAIICAACCTKVDGVNHCHACLMELARPDALAGGRDLTAGFLAVLALGSAWLLFAGLAWLAQGSLAP